MPTYDFLCQRCKNRFSKFASISEKNMIHCPHCGSEEITQVFSAFNFVSGAGIQSNSNSKRGCSGGNCGSCPGC